MPLLLRKNKRLSISSEHFLRRDVGLNYGPDRECGLGFQKFCDRLSSESCHQLRPVFGVKPQVPPSLEGSWEGAVLVGRRHEGGSALGHGSTKEPSRQRRQHQVHHRFSSSTLSMQRHLGGITAKGLAGCSPGPTSRPAPDLSNRCSHQPLRSPGSKTLVEPLEKKSSQQLRI